MTNISQELLHIGFCNLVQVLWIICSFMWKRTRFLLLILPLISSLFFLSNFQISKTFISLFSGTEWHTKLKLGPHMDSRLMYHVYLNQAGVYLFLYFFIFFLTNSKTLIFCHTFLWVLQSWNLIHTWAKGWSIVYTKYKQPEYTCSFIFLLFSISPISKD